MQLTIIWLSSRACQQATAVEELQKLPLHGHSRHRIFFFWLGPPPEKQKQTPRTAGQPAQRGEIGRPKGVHLQSSSRPLLPSLPPASCFPSTPTCRTVTRSIFGSA